MGLRLGVVPLEDDIKWSVPVNIGGFHHGEFRKY